MASWAMLRRLCDDSTLDLRAGLTNAARELSLSPLVGTVVLVVTRGDRPKSVVLDLDRPDVRDIPEEKRVIDTPDFVLYVEEDALLNILRGEISPIQALVQGCLRYSGDVELGLAIFRRLAASQDAIFEPCREARGR